MSGEWIRGAFEGTYVGDRQSPANGPAELRRFSFELHSGTVRDFERVSEAVIERGLAEEQRDEIRQSRLRRVTLETPANGRGARETTLFDVRISDFRLKRPAEADARSYGTVEGTICARLMPQSTPRDDEPLVPQVESESRRPEPSTAKRAQRPEPAPSAKRSQRARRTAPEHVESPGAMEMYARARWAIALFLLGLGALVLGVACGASTAALWAAPILGVMAVRAVLGRFALQTAWLQWPLGVALVAGQLWILAGPLDVAWAQGCRAPIRGDLYALALPLLGAALLRGRGWLLVTTLLWTGVMCTWCSQYDGTCTGVAAVADSPSTTVPKFERSPRTDANGRWPAVPGAPSTRGGGSASAVPGQRPGFGTPLRVSGASPGRSGTPIGVPGGALGPSGAPLDLNGGSAPGSDGNGESITLALESGGSGTTSGTRGESPAAPVTSTKPTNGPKRSRAQGRASTPDGGWVAPDHRRTPRDLVLISVEHANRVPESFFASRGTRRVYLPSDAIFEAGGSRIQSSGTLELSRLAALLSLHPEQRVAIEVHTDASGSAEAQLALSRRRAGQVQRWLQDRGHVEPGQLVLAGVGGRRPLVPPDGSYAAQQPNRRLEVRLID